MAQENKRLYEKTLAGRSLGKQVLVCTLFVALYLSFGALLTLFCLSLEALIYLVFLLPLAEGLLLFFTLPYWNKEYEYSFFGETLTVSRIYGRKKRKKLIEVNLREASAVFPFEDAFRAKAEAFGARHSLYAVPDLGDEHLYLLLLGEGKDKTILCLELDENALAIIGFYNRSALTR